MLEDLATIAAEQEDRAAVVEAVGLWETRSVFQGLWEGIGRRGRGGALP